ncbi:MULTISPECIES: MFS transporter [Streptomyces]|uniref:MFS transporter n=1 Tax=Streptomyces TaxID=1883 RepID=UPI000A07E96C|nr:MFS transporter [Streptomyces sp. MOE7]ARH90001.1 MFS transporter [Streptomyces sp. MOE7]
MYLSSIDRAPKDGAATAPRPAFAAIGRNVLALGAVSLITDISAEMVTAVLPLYFVLTLQMSPAAYGLMDGLYTGATALLRLVGGYVADLTLRRKAVAAAGYGISALAKLGLVAAGSSVGALGAVIVGDRTGKGLRSAPRDALISLSVPETALGRAFGLHRAMDSAGAFAGPLVALGLLSFIGAASPRAFDAIFITSFCIAALAVVVLLAFARDHRAARPTTRTVSPRAVGDLLRRRGVRRLAYAAGLLGLVTIGDGFVYLQLMHRQSVPAGWFPLFAVGTNLVYLLLAAPLGALADRIGRKAMLMCGYGMLFAVYVLLCSPLSGTAATVLTLCCYGTFYAATDGVLMALAGPVLPPELRTTGMALVQTVQALAYFGSSVAFGAAWSQWSAGPATAAAACAVLLAIALTAGALARPRVEEVTV